MGWQQYSRPLWLSRGNHYILYLEAMTALMRTCGLVFHSDLNLVSGLLGTSVSGYRGSPLSGLLDLTALSNFQGWHLGCVCMLRCGALLPVDGRETPVLH